MWSHLSFCYLHDSSVIPRPALGLLARERDLQPRPSHCSLLRLRCLLVLPLALPSYLSHCSAESGQLSNYFCALLANPWHSAVKRMLQESAEPMPSLGSRFCFSYELQPFLLQSSATFFHPLLWSRCKSNIEMWAAPEHGAACFDSALLWCSS